MTDTEIEERIQALMEGDSNDEEIDGLKEIIEQLIDRTSYVIVTRHPDYENEYETFGKVEFIDIDLGGSFDITHVGEEDLDQLIGWAHGYWFDNCGDMPEEVLEAVRNIVFISINESGATGERTSDEIVALIENYKEVE